MYAHYCMHANQTMADSMHKECSYGVEQRLGKDWTKKNVTLEINWYWKVDPKCGDQQVEQGFAAIETIKCHIIGTISVCQTVGMDFIVPATS